MLDQGLAQILRELDEIEARQRRLVHLFTRGELPENMLSAESKSLAERRAALEAQRSAAEPVEVMPRIDVARIRRELPVALLAIRTWIQSAGEDDFDLLLRAVEVQIMASGNQIEMRGSVPLIAEVPQSFATIERTSA